jgi:hypothetical protein
MSNLNKVFESFKRKYNIKDSEMEVFKKKIAERLLKDIKEGGKIV